MTRRSEQKASISLEPILQTVPVRHENLTQKNLIPNMCDHNHISDCETHTCHDAFVRLYISILFEIKNHADVTHDVCIEHNMLMNALLHHDRL